MLKSKIEAILFLTDKPIRAQAIARIVNEDVQLVRQSILELIHDYEERDSGLEIADDNGYIIQVKDEYASITDEFIPMEIPLSLVRTLSAIAIKQPVSQSEIIKIRGAGAYEHIKELVIRELITKKEEGGRSPQLLTTKKFQEYFRLSHDAKSLRTQLRKEEKVEAKSDLGEQLDSGLSQAEAAEQLASVLAQSPALSQPESPQSVAHSEEPEPENAQAVHPKFTEQLEQIFAASPDSSLVFRGTTGSSTPTGFEEWQNQAPPSISEHIETEQSSVVINDSTETASDR